MYRVKELPKKSRSTPQVFWRLCVIQFIWSKAIGHGPGVFSKILQSLLKRAGILTAEVYNARRLMGITGQQQIWDSFSLTGIFRDKKCKLLKSVLENMLTYWIYPYPNNVGLKFSQTLKASKMDASDTGNRKKISGIG
ncbi:hypothetical protein CBL_11248 [Carabus blaptoides fortunei]